MSNPIPLPPFKAFLASNIPSVYDNTLSYYDELTKLIAYIEGVIIPALEANNKEVEEVKKMITTLKDYVDHYFDNLDVQEEINNKLDEMVESGEMEEIITEYFMCQNLDITENFLITNSKTVDEDFPLIYYITRIHANPEKIDHVPLQGYFAGGSFASAGEHPEQLIDMAKKTNAIFMSNADVITESTPNRIWIRDGVVVGDNYTSDSKMIAQTAGGDLMLYDKTYTAEDLINTYHVQNSWKSHGEIIIDGNLDANNWYAQSLIEPSVVNERHPRTAIFQLANDKDIYFIHVEGRKPTSAGVTFMELGTLVQTMFPTVRLLVNFGGGGDSQLLLKGVYKNDCTDAQLRTLHDCIYLNANIHEDTYNTFESEIADGRNLTNTLHELLTTFLPYDKKYLSAQKVLTARHLTGNKFVCDLDYNTSLNDGDSVLIEFDALDDAGIVDGDPVTINIHSSENGQTNLRQKSNGYNLTAHQLRNRIVVATWNGNNYVVDDGHLFANTVQATTSINDMKEGGLYFSGTFTDRPVNQGGWLAVIPSTNSDDYLYQIYLARPSGAIYYRLIEGGTAGNWKHIVNEDDVIPSAVESISDADADDIVGKIRFCYGNNITNKPASTANGWLINIPYTAGASAGDYGQQIFMERYTDSSHGRIYVRTLENGTWSAWRQLAFVA